MKSLFALALLAAPLLSQAAAPASIEIIPNPIVCESQGGSTPLKLTIQYFGRTGGNQLTFSVSELDPETFDVGKIYILNTGRDYIHQMDIDLDYDLVLSGGEVDQLVRDLDSHQLGKDYSFEGKLSIFNHRKIPVVCKAKLAR